VWSDTAWEGNDSPFFVSGLQLPIKTAKHSTTTLQKQRKTYFNTEISTLYTVKPVLSCTAYLALSDSFGKKLFKLGKNERKLYFFIL
jgi:hypothetical protein